jgi:hypothetical protein
VWWLIDLALMLLEYLLMIFFKEFDGASQEDTQIVAVPSEGPTHSIFINFVTVQKFIHQVQGGAERGQQTGEYLLCSQADMPLSTVNSFSFGF